MSDPTTTTTTHDPSWLASFVDWVRGKPAAPVTATVEQGAALAACDVRSFAEPHPGLFVGLFLDAASAGTLAIEGGQPAALLHITLCYHDEFSLDELTLARIVSRIDDACIWRAPLTGNVAGYGRFFGDDGVDTFYATPAVTGLDDLAVSIRSAVESSFYPMSAPDTRDAYAFVPHISLAFIGSSDANPVDTLPDAALRFDAVTVSYDGREIVIPFRGQAEGAYGYSEIVVAADDDGPRLFLEQAFAEPPKRVAILPTPGSYAHAQYGTVDITAERVDRFVANHNAGVYGQSLPVQIDAGHDLKFSGAMGWLGSARVEPDGSATAEVFWNPRGEQLIKEDRIKYLSPEWWDEWCDSVTGTKYQDVLIGLALTNRPFFKAASLTPLAATEDVADQPDDRQGGISVSDNTPVAMTEEQIKAFRDQLAGEIRQEFEGKITAETTARQAAEQRVAGLEEAAETKRFTDEITGRAPDNDQGAYVFHAEFGADYLQIMRALPVDLRAKYQEIERRKAASFAEQMRQLGTPVGSDARGVTATAEAEAEKRARAAHAADPSKSYHQHYEEIVNTDADLNRRIAAEQKGR